MRATLTKELALKRLARKCRQWGGDLQYREREFFDHHNKSSEVYEDRLFCAAPFTGWDLGVIHRDQRVLYGSHAEPEQVPVYATSLIHEMAHCFASLVPPNRMIAKDDDSNEFQFFGWEFLLARQIGLSIKDFYVGNQDYSVDHGDTVGAMMSSKSGRQKLRACMHDRVTRGQQLAIIVNGTPVSIREVP